MHENVSEPSPFATIAIMWLLTRSGGTLRTGPLLRQANLPVDELCAVLNGLAERRWIKVTWRHAPCERLPPRLRRVERVTTTRWGRSRMIREPRQPAPHPALRPRG